MYSNETKFIPSRTEDTRHTSDEAYSAINSLNDIDWNMKWTGTKSIVPAAWDELVTTRVKLNRRMGQTHTEPAINLTDELVNSVLEVHVVPYSLPAGHGYLDKH